MLQSITHFYHKHFLSLIRAVVLIVGALFFGGGCPEQPVGSDQEYPPSPPYYLLITSLSDHSLILSWTNNYGNNNITFKIERADSTAAFRQIDAASGGASQYVDTEINRKTKYSYRVRAVRDNLVSQPSKAVTVEYGSTSVQLKVINMNYEVGKLLITPDGKQLISACKGDTSLTVWNTDTWSNFRISGNKYAPPAITFTNDSKFAVIGGDTSISIRNLTDGSVVKYIDSDSDRVQDLVLNYDNSKLITADDHGRLRLYQYPSGKFIRNLDSAKYGTWTLDASPSADRMTACSYLVMKEWDFTTNNIRNTAFEHFISPCYSPSGSFLTVNSTTTPPVLLTYRMSDWGMQYSSEGYSYSNAFSPDEQKQFMGYGNLIRIFEVPSGNIIQSISAHSNIITGLVCFPDGKTFASGSWDRTIKIWSLLQSAQWHIVS